MAKVFKQIEKLEAFEKDFKRLLKKFKTLDGDFKTFISAQLKLYHKLGIDNGGIFRLTGTGFTYPPVYKAKKFTCRSLKGRGAGSGIRVIYAYYEEEDKIFFIEIYYKGDKDGEERGRFGLVDR
jgi:mRNA-degrading endonuclease RelE of RelBE toxin-antitoxin system